MDTEISRPESTGLSPSRRELLATAGALFAADVGIGAAAAQTVPQPKPGASAGKQANGAMHRQKLVGFMLGHEQFTVPQLVDAGKLAAQAGFNLLATSDHFQPWQANEGHCGKAWVTLGALGERAQGAWMGTTVTCPTMRYNPAIVAEAFASLAALYPGRVFLGVGSGEALNEQAATGMWPAWPERWERLAEAIAIIRALWSGEPVKHQGKYYTVDGKLYDPPPQPIPLLTAANGKKSMRLAGLHGDGLITDPMTWKKHKAEWEAGAQEAGKDTAQMPVLIEQFIVVGGKEAAERAAEKWRFIPKAFKKYYNIGDPAEIQRQAEADLPLDKVYADWPVGTDPAVHIDAIEKLFADGATIVNIHSGQDDQKKVIDFYGNNVLPKLNIRT
ncbi:MAG: TIGR03557 family F420-dependent LLM class oxidoreductase [Alphaproteobacteria bacterium]|nr:TIGR03557 family F420-dependent LLM class oxidoreductase [Alphaproteobacteria bacterium]MBV9587354.1 TIGR03557 family F420-dependent LLM class oxidoreductase [Alphaproteobacteria bacterium]